MFIISKKPRLRRERESKRLFHFIKFTLLVSIFILCFARIKLFVSAGSTDTLVFSDNFESRTLGGLDGQNGWTKFGACPNWQVQSNGAGGQNIIQSAVACSYNNSQITQTNTFIQDSRIKVDFIAVNTTAGPQVWLRRPTATSTQGYDLFQYGTSLYLDFINASGSPIVLSSTTSALTVGNWYTIEFEAVNDGSGNPVLKGWVYPQGGSRPGTPTVTSTDTNKYLATAGYPGLATYQGTVTLDNVEIYSGSISVPQIPTNLSATSSSASVPLSWTAPNNGGSAITDYLIEYKQTASSSWSTFSDGISTSTSATVTGLTNDISYDFRVSAINAIGTGTPSSIVTATPRATVTVPAAISSVTPAASSGQVSCSWIAPDNGGSAITDYIIEYKQTATSSWSTFSDGVSASTSATVTGLTNNISYNFRVSAVNAIGTGAPSSIATATPIATAVPVPLFYLSLNGDYLDTSGNSSNGLVGGGGNSFVNDATRGQQVLSVTGNGWAAVNVALPTNFTKAIWIKWGGSNPNGYANFFSNVSSSLFLLNTSNQLSAGLGVPLPANDSITFPVNTWTHAAVTFDAATKAYKIYRNGSMVASGTDTVLPAASSQTLVGGYSNAQYSFIGSVANAEMWNSVLSDSQIAAVYGGSYGIASSTAPATTTNLTPTAGSGQVSLSWTAPNNGGSAITDYIIEYKQTATSSWSTFSDGVSASTSATVTGLTNDISYDFRVSAVNAIGTGAPSSIATATPIGQNISITSPSHDVTGAPYVATISIRRDECNETFYIPYIQTSSSLVVSASVLPAALPSGGGLKFVLDEGQASEHVMYDLSAPFSVTFTNLSKGEHRLDTYIVDANQVVQSGASNHTYLTNIGVGDIYVAIGDSVTEGYDGTAYNVSPYTDWLSVPVKSTDNRNYPQCGISSGYYQDHWQEVSHHISLNNELESLLGYPVFILNEGVAGITSSGYITRMASSTWQNRINALAPNKWLLHLGINDGGGSAGFQTNMQTIINTLKNTYLATGTNIVLAVPSTRTGWQPYINNLISANSLTAGPDFNTYYSNHSGNIPTLYSGVHPTAAGHVQMARLWAISMLYPKNVGISQNRGTTTISWDNLSSIESTIAGYKVKYGTASGVYSTTVDVGNATSTTISGLTSGQTYYFTVSAYDNDATSTNQTSNSPEASIIYDTSIPTVSSSPVNTPISGGSIITWSTNENSSSQIDYGLTASYSTSTPETNTSTRVTSHSVSLSGLVSCATYHYRVRSKDVALYEATSTDQTFTTSGCAASATVVSTGSSQIATSTGGTLTLSNFSLTVPVAFGSADANFQAHQLNTADVLPTISSPSGYTSAGSYLYDLKALPSISTTTSSFDQSLTVTMSYSASDIAGLNESTLKISRWDGAAWNELSGCSVNTSAKTVTCTTTHFSVFGLFGQTLAQTSSSAAASGMPLEWYNAPQAPAGGFSISINNDAKSVSSPMVALSLKGGSDTVKMAISNSIDFQYAAQDNYMAATTWNLCWSNVSSKTPSSCPAGTYTVYAKFYAPWGKSSEIVSDSIIYEPNAVISPAPATLIFSKALALRLSGRILLQVESRGEAWYVNPINHLRYYLGRPDDAFNIMRSLGLGVSNADLANFKVSAPARLSGRILLQVQDKGQAYYVNPVNLKLYYLGRPDDAYALMRSKGLGITNNDLMKMETGTLNK